jgi:hypothetical protein
VTLDSKSRQESDREPSLDGINSPAIGIMNPSNTYEEVDQRVGPYSLIPVLLRELGADPDKVLRAAGLGPDVLNDMENRIPFLAIGRLLHECAVKTRCPHFGLLVGQRTSLSHLGQPGELMRYAATLRTAAQTFDAYHHLNSRGIATFTREDNGLVISGYAIYQIGTECVDQIYDCVVAMD